MKPKTLLVMLGLVLGLGAFIWFFEKDVPSTEERQVQDKKLLGELKSEDVTAVAIARDGKTVKLERDPKPADKKSADGTTAPAAERAWRLTQPLQATADRWAVDRLVDSLTGLTKDRVMDAGDRKELGFDTPRAKVTLSAGGRDTVVEIGAAIPASTNMAVAVAGEAPVIVPNSVFTDLSKEAGDWRSKELFAGKREDIQRITITPAAGGGPAVTLAKKGEDFRLETPTADRADRDAVNALLGDLTGLQAAKFVDTPPAAGSSWSDTVEVQLQGQTKPWRLEIGGAMSEPAAPATPADPKTQTLVRVDGVLALTDSKIADLLRKPAAEWRSTRWASFEVFRIEGLEIDDAKGHLALRRQDADWMRGSDRISFTPVSDLLYAVTGARGDQLVSRAEALAAGATLANPVVTVKLLAADKSAETLTLYPALASGLSPATASGRDDVIVLLNKTFVDDLTAKVQGVRGAEPQPVKAREGAGKQG